MQKIHFTIHIDAPREKVWDTMLQDATYRQWTKAFGENSRYVGDWSEGSKILFLGSDENGNEADMGMVSRIKVNRKHEFISIEHVGMISNGIEDTTSDEAKKWAPAFENYSFVDKDGGTELSVDLDVADEFKDMFEDSWPKSLQALKELCEKGV